MDILSTKRSPHPYGFNEVDNWLSFQPIEISISQDGANWVSYYDVPELENFYCYQVDIDRANPIVGLQKYTNRNGQTIANASYDPRNITAHFYGRVKGDNDAELASNCLESFFASYNGFWIVFGNKPFKKYFVKVTQPKITGQGTSYLMMDFTFQDLNGLAQSVLPSIQLSDELENLGLGMGITDDDQMNFLFFNSDFSVYNPSDIEIDPLAQKHPLEIVVQGDGKPTITNQTTGDVFTLDKELTKTDRLIIRLVNPYVNNEPVGILSNHGVITLKPGENKIKIDGMGDNVYCSFNFPFYYYS